MARRSNPAGSDGIGRGGGWKSEVLARRQALAEAMVERDRARIKLRATQRRVDEASAALLEVIDEGDQT